jgi:hypothetical protein
VDDIVGRPLIVADGAGLASCSDLLAWLRTFSRLTDGVLVRCSRLSDAPAFADLIAMIDAVRPDGLIWAEVDSLEDVSDLTPTVRHADSCSRLTVLAQSPELMRAAASEWADCDIRLLLRANRPSEFTGENPPCPYSGVCMPEAIATHVHIQNVRRSGKEVAVSTPEKWGRRRKRTIPEQLNWYSHESVDWIVAADPWAWTSALAKQV